MKNKNELHVSTNLNKVINNLTNLSETIKKGQLIAEKISSLKFDDINKLLQNRNNIINTNLSINKTAFLTPHLDIGGSGEAIIYKISKNKLTIIDLDIDRKIDSKRVEMHRMDARNLKFEDNKFLTITSFYTLMYVCCNDILRIFHECYRVLQNGGVFKIWDVNIDQIPSGFTNVSLDISCGNKVYHAEYSSNAIQEIRDQEFYRTLLEDSGFKDVNINTQNNCIIIEAYKGTTLDLGYSRLD
ncbi:class I SAM-dependent methyltransferase [Lutispora thermophila]|uniref:Methyltransferase domain-containing protein n=1 Tax=Lutispora thermophila DSM 19022 TaxID=1122184 RepID=A0A1M6INB8_9FIRM|nr:class I SAM-dependent methyltransferase [Lutispora thermophila]SHJ35964.1 Methyltransferase domain-containing protein [Lutispora thermophila DSM 19022]